MLYIQWLIPFYLIDGIQRAVEIRHKPVFLVLIVVTSSYNVKII